jgi:peroxiredoxin
MDTLFLVSNIVLWVFVLFNFILTLALIRRGTAGAGPNAATRPNGLPAGEEAPPFTAETLAGEAVTLSTFAGRNVAFIFFGLDCGPCLEALPDYEALYPQARQKGTDIILVSTDTSEHTRAFVEEHQVQCPMLVADKAFMTDYKIRGTPSYTLVDPVGKIVSAGPTSRNVKGWRELVSSWEAAELQLAEAHSS